MSFDLMSLIYLFWLDVKGLAAQIGNDRRFDAKRHVSSDSCSTGRRRVSVYGLRNALEKIKEGNFQKRGKNSIT